MAVHVFPSATEPTAGRRWSTTWPSGRASALFAVLAGVGLALLSGGPTPAGRRPAAAGRRRPGGPGGAGRARARPARLRPRGDPRLLRRAVPGRAPAAAAARSGAGGRWRVLAALGTPVLSLLLRPSLPERLLANPSVGDLLLDPGRLVATLLVTGYYPVLCWTTYLCAGLAVGRLDLASRARRRPAGPRGSGAGRDGVAGQRAAARPARRAGPDRRGPAAGGGRAGGRGRQPVRQRAGRRQPVVAGHRRAARLDAARPAAHHRDGAARARARAAAGPAARCARCGRSPRSAR